MLPEITQFEETVTLVSDTGIQFMDFALRLGPDGEQTGKFVQLNNGMVPTRLLWSKEYKDFYEPEPDKVVQVEFDTSEESHFRLPMEDSLKLLDAFGFEDGHVVRRWPNLMAGTAVFVLQR